jgi:hypothetical protein
MNDTTPFEAKASGAVATRASAQAAVRANAPAMARRTPGVFELAIISRKSSPRLLAANGVGSRR